MIELDPPVFAGLRPYLYRVGDVVTLKGWDGQQVQITGLGLDGDIREYRVRFLGPIWTHRSWAWENVLEPLE